MPTSSAASKDAHGFGLQLLRSATIKLRVGGHMLLVDPYLADAHQGRCYGGPVRSPLVPLPVPVDELLADVDAVFVSHLHSDHFDDAARERLPRDLPLLCPAALAAEIRSLGFRDVTAIVDRLAWAGVELTLTGGRHGPDALLPTIGDVNGFVLRGPGLPVLYWVGDSIWCPEVRDVVDRFEPDWIVVHACGAAWGAHEPLVMDAHHVEALLRHARRPRVIATHMDSVDHATVSRADLARHFATRRDLQARLSVPADGQWLDLALGH